MKKRISSSLLVAMLAVGSTGMLVSCSDYDDDITNLQEQIDKLATADELASQISTMTSAIQQAKDEAIAQANAANQVAAAAQQAADNAQATAEGAQQVADAAAARAAELEANGATKAEVEAAQQAADAAQQFANQAKADADAAIAQLQEALDQAVAAATAAVQNAQNTADEAKTAAEAAQAAAEKAIEDAMAYTDEKAAENAQAAAEALAAAERAQIAAEQGITDAAAALAAAEAAAGETEKAQAAAELANTAAANAQAAADEAQKTADEINAQLTSLLASVANAATKAELQAAQDALNTAIADAKKAATDVANTAKTAADAAKATADQALSVANGAAASIKTIEAQINNETTGLAALNTKLQTVSADLAANTKDINTLKARVDAIDGELKKIIGEYSTMVTSVSLYTGGDIADFDNVFTKVVEKENVFPKNGETGDDKFVFTKDFTTTDTVEVVVRVSPINAVVSKENISLINSQGTEISDIVECVDVEKYENLLTRASSNNGLWTLKFKLKDGYNASDFASKTVSGGKGILYAVAVKNTELSEEDRRVISSYDLTFSAEDFTAADNNFLITNKMGDQVSIADIHNRYSYSEEDNTPVEYKELVWSGNAATSATSSNTRQGDNRQNKTILPVEVDKAIDIEYVPATAGVGKKIKGFYVTLDYKECAVSSAPSEYNAWTSYDYEGLNTLFKGNKGSIKVNSDVKNEVIGFRIFAVNLDGTLVDPDGRSFYVRFGDAYSTSEIAETKIEVKSTVAGQNESAAIPVDGIFTNCVSVDGWTVSDDNTTVVDNGKALDNDFAVEYYADEACTRRITNPSDFGKIKYVKFVMTHEPKNYADFATYTQTLVLKDKDGNAIKTITAKMTKDMPKSFAGNFAIRVNQNFDGDFNVRPYMQPLDGDDWVATVKATEGKSNLKDLFYGLTADEDGANYKNYRFVFRNSYNSVINPNITVEYDNTADAYELTVNKSFFSKTKKYDVDVYYKYDDISSTYNAATRTWTVGGPYTVPYGEDLTVQYYTWYYDTEESIKWARSQTIEWTTNGNGDQIALSLISTTNSRNEAFSGNLWNLINAKKYLEVVPNSAQLTIDGQVNPYFKPSINVSTGMIEFEQNSVQVEQAPNRSHVETLSFKVRDTYGFEYTISLPVTIDNPAM